MQRRKCLQWKHLIFYAFPIFIDDLLCFQMYERVEELICEQSLADMMYFTENDGKLRLDTFSL